ncbi:uncharacterized protein GGS22DRAFT_185365 [Annulohypoxylon maeteangense]|uniref:uncharacterized protein n=1 Tax=Annulohypoxylon maeteangense TaxID=1927788 RepID=UPI002008BE91|nr:uncharacterized protein GGS22DRAFT_185365 [Annulohypoxylon maeteangense]KAI0887983.1 hypothetical protein GGS22DRAFT_185365 [Annulohypoxylon maeteangense]
MGAIDNEKASELRRDSSLRASVRFSNVQGNDEDYDLQAMGIADGFRPVELTHNEISRQSTTTPQDAPTVQKSPPRPSSITKPHQRNESLALQHDGSTTDSDSDRTGLDRSSTRDSTISTSSPFVDVEDPYEGPSGPSHPYQMYPQDVRLARTASLATTSTAPISEQSYNGPHGPAHPYGMYPQNTIPESDGVPNRTAQAEINIGFPGTTDNYQRRIGPEGEDVADLIGPDGHTEQLPPYTRYPEEAYTRKAMGVETPQPAPVQAMPSIQPIQQPEQQPQQPQPQHPQPMLAIPGAGGIGMATLNPEFTSTEDLGDMNSPQSRQSVRSFTSDNSQRGLTATPRSDQEILDEKKSLKDWQVTAKRRVWGIVPCWAIILAAIVLVLMGIILGAVIGTLLNPHFKKPPPPDRPPSQAQSPNNWDTQPLSTLPPDLPPLPTGTYSMFLARNNRISNTCFTDPTLAQAWSCDLTFFQLSMNVKKLPGQPNISDYSFGFSYNDTYSLKNNVFTYGVQPPDLTDLQMKLVSDIFEVPRGPAWNFEISYNKTAIIPEPFITASSGSPPSSPTSSSNRRRMMFGGNDAKRKGVMAQPGDKPWVCHWDNTILEAFIYAGQNNSFSRPIDPGPTTSPPASSSDSKVSAAATTSGAVADAANDFSGPSRAPFADDLQATTSVSDGLPSTTTASASASTSGFDKDLPMPSGTPSMPSPPYPRVVKVEERRNAGSTTVKPWCRQYQIRGDNQAPVPALDANGKFIDIVINEDEGGYDESGGSKRKIERYLGTRNSAKGTDMSDCGCIWWLS